MRIEEYLLLIILIIGFLLTIIFTDTSIEENEDMYFNATYFRDDFYIKVNVISSDEIPLHCGDKTNGCALIYSNPESIKTNCTVYLPKIENETNLRTWGHELSHCVYGSWHTKKNET